MQVIQHMLFDVLPLIKTSVYCKMHCNTLLAVSSDGIASMSWQRMLAARKLQYVLHPTHQYKMSLSHQGHYTCFDGAAGEEAEWQLQPAQHVEQALLSQQASMDTIGRALAAVSRDVQPGSVPDAAFLVAAAEGVLFEGLASLLRQVGLFLLHGKDCESCMSCAS